MQTKPGVDPDGEEVEQDQEDGEGSRGEEALNPAGEPVPEGDAIRGLLDPFVPVELRVPRGGVPRRG